MDVRLQGIGRRIFACLAAIAISGCIFPPGGTGFSASSDSEQGTFSGTVDIESCSLSAAPPNIGILTCNVFGIPVSMEGPLLVLELLGIIYDPVILQVPASASGFTASMQTANGTTGLIVTSGLTSIPIDANTTLTAEPGMQLVVLDVPPGTQAGPVVFTVRYANPGATMKAIFAAKVTVNGISYYPPLAPCVADFASIPPVSTSTSLSVAQVTTMAASMPLCRHKAYVFPPVNPAAVEAVEFYHAGLDHYFITWVAAEIAALDAGTQIRGWQRTGRSIPVYRAAVGGTEPVCRFYIPPGSGDSHFFGRGRTECDQTAARFPAFTLEDAAFMYTTLPNAGACPNQSTPVYRVFSNRLDANHRYMTDRALRDAMVAQGWLAEGDGPDQVVMCGPA